MSFKNWGKWNSIRSRAFFIFLTHACPKLNGVTIFFYPIFRKTSWPSLICRHVLNFLRVKSTFSKCKFRICSSISSHQMLENWDFSRRSRKAVLDTFLSIFRILRTSKSSQRYENYNTFILMKSQTSFVRAPIPI